MRVLIIGGTGLISTAITRLLVERGDAVTHFNRGKTPPRVPAGVQRITGDRTDFPRFEEQMRGAGPFDCVIDMVCYRPEEAESAVRAFRGRAGHFVFCSTVDVYARPASRYPIREEEPHRPLSPYGKNKARCEAILLEAHRRGDLPVTTLRPAHTYGEGGIIIHSFGGKTTYLDRIRRGKPIPVHGDGNSLWVSCHVDDVGRAFAAAAGRRDVVGKAYHVTGEEWMTWNRYHQGVAEALGAPAPVLVHIPTDLLARIAPERAGTCAVNFQFNNIFDNTAAREDLGFRYTIPWVEGIRRTVAWLDANGQILDSDEDPFEDRLITAWERLGARMADELGPLRGKTATSGNDQ